MAVAVGGVSSASGNTASLAWAHTIGFTGNLLLVGLCLDDGITASGGVTYGATAMTLLAGSRIQNAGAAVTEIWYLDNVLTSETITVSLSSKSMAIAGAVDFSGADTAPDNVAGSSPDGVASVSDTVTGVGADDFVFDCIREPGAAPTVGANQTAQWNLAGGGERGGGSTQDGVDGGVMSWDNGTTDWAHSACRVPVAPVVGASLAIPSRVRWDPNLRR